MERSWNFLNVSVLSTDSENRSVELKTSAENPRNNTLYVSFEMKTLKKFGDQKKVFIEDSTTLTKAKLQRLFISLNYSILTIC